MNILFIFAKRFIAGLTLDEALKVVKSLNAKGFSTTLDHLGEDVNNPEEAREAARTYELMLSELNNNKLSPNVSVKPTQIGLRISKDEFARNLKSICSKAKELHGFVRVDMEGSDTTSMTINIINEIKAQGYPVGGVIQSMLRRSSADTISLLEKGATIRLCKGAYKEPVDVAYQDKKEIIRQYMALMKRLLTSEIYNGIATHDEELIAKTMNFAKEQRINSDKFEFQMLYGIRPSLQQKIIDGGWRLRIYVPFGKSWLPYTYRRLRERKENVWFVLKNLFRK